MKKYIKKKMAKHVGPLVLLLMYSRVCTPAKYLSKIIKKIDYYHWKAGVGVDFLQNPHGPFKSIVTSET